jgi:hypothetical protein
MVTRLGLAQRTDLQNLHRRTSYGIRGSSGGIAPSLNRAAMGRVGVSYLRTIRHRYRGVAGICETGLTVSEPS